VIIGDVSGTKLRSKVKYYYKYFVHISRRKCRGVLNLGVSIEFGRMPIYALLIYYNRDGFIWELNPEKAINSLRPWTQVQV